MTHTWWFKCLLWMTVLEHIKLAYQCLWFVTFKYVDLNQRRVWDKTNVFFQISTAKQKIFFHFSLPLRMVRWRFMVLAPKKKLTFCLFRADNETLVDSLIRNGHNVNIMDFYGDTALHVAAKNGLKMKLIIRIGKWINHFQV